MRSRFAIAALGWLALGMLWACSRQEAAAPQATTTSPTAAAVPAQAAAGDEAGEEPGEEPGEEAREAAKQIFETRCVACHGAQGAGDGPASAGLTPPPRNFQDSEWQKSVSDAHIEQIIQYGGAAVGKSPAMPANPDLMSKPEVVAALRERLRGLAH